MSEKFFITLRDAERPEKGHIKLYMTPTGHALSQFWMNTLKENFLNPNNISQSKGINKMFCFQGWQKSWDDVEYTRNLKVQCDELNVAIAEVNRHYGPYGYPHIDAVVTEEKVRGPEFRDLMNELHHHFELLIGQVGNTSEWYNKPGTDLSRYYVTQLNFLVHEIEATVKFLRDGLGGKCVYVNYNGPRPTGSYEPKGRLLPLADEHYECFVDQFPQWGMLTAYYSQLGKQHIEVFNDHDDCIHDENITGIQWMMGESILCLVHNDPGSVPIKRIRGEYRDWLVANGFDPEDKKLALGIGVLAKLEIDDNKHLGNDWLEMDAKISEYDDIYEVGFCDENLNTTVSQVYDYTWKSRQQEVVAAMERLAVWQSENKTVAINE